MARYIFQFFIIFIGLLPCVGLSATFTANSFYDADDLTPGNGLYVAFLIIVPPFPTGVSASQ